MTTYINNFLTNEESSDLFNELESIDWLSVDKIKFETCDDIMRHITEKYVNHISDERLCRQIYNEIISLGMVEILNREYHKNFNDIKVLLNGSSINILPVYKIVLPTLFLNRKELDTSIEHEIFLHPHKSSVTITYKIGYPFSTETMQNLTRVHYLYRSQIPQVTFEDSTNNKRFTRMIECVDCITIKGNIKQKNGI